MAAEYFSQGNEAFVDEDYQSAINHYSNALSLDDSNSNYYTKRGIARTKLGQHKDAIADFEKSIDLDPSKPNTYLKKGQAEIELKQFAEANKSFQRGSSLQGADANIFEDWIERCKSELKEIEPSGNGKENEKTQKETSTSKEADKSKQENKQAKAPPKIRYDWYQTDHYVVLSVMVKNLKKEDVKINITKQNLCVAIRLASDPDYKLDINLAHEIDENQSRTQIFSTKIEIKLKKCEGIRWSSLETNNECGLTVLPTASSGATSSGAGSETEIKRYPTSSRHYQDWDKLAAEITKEEKEEKLDGEAGINQLFQGIYADGSDEVRRAMNKSFQESGGTVLSTNWKDIGKKTVECKPPDGMEYKKYEI